MALSVFELLADSLTTSALGLGAFALEAQADTMFALSVVQRSNRRVALQGAAWRCAAAAQRHRRMMWHERYTGVTQSISSIFDTIGDLEQDRVVTWRAPQLARLRAVDAELLRRVQSWRPALAPWVDAERRVLMENIGDSSDEESNEDGDEQ